MILFTKYETNYRILSLLTHKNSKKKNFLLNLRQLLTKHCNKNKFVTNLKTATLKCDEDYFFHL